MSQVRLPPDAAAPSSLLGRDRQLAGVAHAVARVRTGRAQFVLIEGESGFGKSALLRAAVETVPLWPLRSAVADVAEAELPYGVLNQLLAELDDPDSLDPMLRHGIAPEVPSLVAGAALLELIDASEGATCVTIDDAQWMDQRSAEALWFAGRRSFRDRLLVIIAARPEETAFLERMRRLVADDERGVRLQVDGLSVDHVSTLIRRRTGTQAPRRLAARLVAATDGNVLHVQTLLNQAISGTDPLTLLDRLLDGTPPAAPGFRAITRAALTATGPAARALIEVLAVLNDSASVTDAAAVVALSHGHRLSSADIDEALSTGFVALVADDTEVRMQHERVRAVVVADLPLQSKRDINAAAGRVIAGHRGLAHRVHAAAGPDDGLAAELDEAAAIAAANAEVERAFRYARWAASLTSDPADTERRIVDAGVYALSARRLGLLDSAVGEFENLSVGPERELLLGIAALMSADPVPARLHLLKATMATGPGETVRSRSMRALASETLAALALAGDDFDAALQFASAAQELLAESKNSEPGPEIGARLDVGEIEGNVACWLALASWQSGRGAVGQQRLDELIEEAARHGYRPRHAVLLLTRGFFRRQQSRYGEAIADLETGVRLADLGRADLAAYGRIELVLARFRNGQWDAASAVAAAAASLAEDVQNPLLRATSSAIAALVPAARGDRETALAWLAEAEADPAVLRTATLRRITHLARALAARAEGDTETVVKLARSAIATEPVNAQIERAWWQELLTEALGPPAPGGRADPLAVLSSREREVAHLAAQGLTNREVAQRLFVSVKGVEYHMGNVLAKLGLTSRRGIRALIERN